jgi:carboxypeptidase family protein
MKKKIAATLTLLLFLMNLGGLAYAQGNIELRGTVLDETKAYLPAVQVVLEDAQGTKRTVQTDDLGRYRFTGLKAGVYTLRVEAEGFAKFVEQLDLTEKRTTSFDVVMKVFISEQLEVKNDAAGISAEPDKNLTAITLTEHDLEALPDDPDELLQRLREMAGAAGGSDEAAIYVGGFRERGRIPPKEAIQMIRINSNPFSAEFSEIGFSRIEIITKPGSDTFHGGFRFNFNDESLNARNAFAPERAPLQSRTWGGNFSGPIIRNRWGFFANVDRRAVDENEVINARVLDPVTLALNPFVTTVLTPQRNFNFDVRSDYLMTKKHTIGFGYRFNRNEARNQGLGPFDLPERAFDREFREHTLRLSFTSIVSEHAVNEMRMQLSRRISSTRAQNDAPAIIVADAFSFGGNQGALFADSTNENLDFTNNLTYTYKKHTIKVGIRTEATHLENINLSNFGGTYTFGTDFERDNLGRVVDAKGDPIVSAIQAPVTISALEQYRRVLLGLPGYRPLQFSINRGDPFVGFSQWETGLFVQDDWRVSPRLTLSYGLRQEFQTHLQDKLNTAPRFGLAWVPDKKNKSTIRAGAGIFYNRLDTGITFDTLRNDGLHQQQFVIQSPDFFPNIPDTSGTSSRRPVIRLKADELNAPYSINATIGYERQLPWKMFGSATYSWFRGIHLLRLRNINAPIPGERDSEGRPVVPFPDRGQLLQYESTGLSNRHEMRFGIRTNFSRRFSLFGNYILARTRSDTDGSSAISADPYDLTIEYGRAGNDTRHQVFVGGSFTLPWNLRVSPFVRAVSGRPFNITTGRDDNGDRTINDRPAFASAGDPGAIVTRFGVFNPTPRLGDEIIPRNFGEGPSFVTVDMSISKTFGFGPAQGGFPGAQANNRAGQQGNQPGQSQSGQNQSGQNQSGQNQSGQNQSGQNQSGQNQRGNNQNRGGQGGQGGGRAGGAGGQGGGAAPAVMRGGGGGMGGGGFAGGPGGFFGDARHKYNMTLSINVRNLLNTTNLSNFNGVLTSPFFGTANRALESRRIEASLRFNF